MGDMKLGKESVNPGSPKRGTGLPGVGKSVTPCLGPALLTPERVAPSNFFLVCGESGPSLARLPHCQHSRPLAGSEANDPF